jgi:subtilisin family serine protease
MAASKRKGYRLLRKKPDEQARRLHPRLRVYANCDEEVNALRADLSVAVASTLAPKVAPAAQSMADRDPSEAQRCQLYLSRESAPEVAPKLKGYKRLSQQPAAKHAFVNVFVQFQRPQGGSAEKHQRAAEAKMTAKLKAASTNALARKVGGEFLARRNFVAATIPVAMLADLKASDAVAFVHPAEPLKLDLPVAAAATAPASRAIQGGAANWKSKGVLIGIIDVGGFDFAHPDFLDKKGLTRFHSIWDQGASLRPPPHGFSYGSLIEKPHMDAAIKAAGKPGGLPAHLLEAQSQQVESSHGTHVASIAAGNKGVCPEAVIAAVLIDVPQPADERERRRGTFSDSSRIVHAVEHLVNVADSLGLPLSVNISLGTNGGAHDGSSGPCRWIDNMLATPGRAVCVAAGNAGQESAEREDDFGWVMGRIHTSGKVPSKGLEVDLDWTVIGNGIADVSENELELWYSPQDRISVLLQPPDSQEWFEVKPGEFIENHRLASGTRISAYNEVYHPVSGANYIAVYLTPNLKQGAFVGVQAGVWRVRLRGDDIRDGSFHGWIERDDPNEIGRQGGMRLFRFPSFFSARTNVDSHSINSLACAHRVIGVANIDDLRQKIHITSSQGPTRDGRLKPDICAPGTNIVAANGFAAGHERWTEMTGTSMASPYVCGVIALMLAKEPGLTAAQCLGILQRTSQPIPGASYQWQNDAGFGRIAPEKAIAEAVNLNARREVRP